MNSNCVITRTKSSRQAVSSPLQIPNMQNKSAKCDSPPTPSWLSRLETKMQVQKESIISELAARLSQSEERVMQRIGELTAGLSNLNKSVKNIEVRVERVEKECAIVQQLRNDVEVLSKQVDECQNALVSSDLIIRGIPLTKNEKLTDCFAQLCRAVQIVTPPIRAIFRARNDNNNKDNSKAAPIIAKLGSASDRSVLFSAVAKFCKNKKRPLTLRDVGQSADDKIYLHESLTKRNREVMQFATELKRQKRLTSVFSMRGNVFVRVQTQGEAVKVISVDNIKQIAAVNK